MTFIATLEGLTEMPTNEERREVAKRIRENAERCPGMSLILNVAFADDALKKDDLKEYTVTSYEAAIRLADLIEPEPESTCRRVVVYSLHGSMSYKGCSRCHNPLDALDLYCSRCGAKVVD